MLIGFLGIPSSGKTTLAAMTFVELKRMGVSAEFVVEIARSYIALKRQQGQDNVVLLDEDQAQIMRQQAAAERLMNDKRVIVVSDSSPLNSLLYLTDGAFEASINSQEVAGLCLGYDMVVVCREPNGPIVKDLNRVHGEESRRSLTERLETVVGFLRLKAPGLTLIDRQFHEDLSSSIAFQAVDAFYASAKT
jgi:nicotinamide riboside kinase